MTRLCSIKGGCLDGLTQEMVQNAVHIFTKRAIIEIPPGVKHFEGETVD